MKYPLEIYINGVEVDQFSDESVTIKKSVKSFKDVKKLFTDFSKTFSIPTSKKNNKLFKHVYRVDTNAVDARVLIPAVLKLNGVDFKSGNVSVEGTQFKDGKPYAYKIRFYGKLTELNKLIGQDELTDLDFSSLDISSPNFSSLFSSQVASDAIKFPLICRDGRYIAHTSDYDFAKTEGLSKTKNIAYSTTTREQGYYGLVDNDMMGALRVKEILDAMETKYGITIEGAMRADYVEDLHLVLQKTDQTTIEGGTSASTYGFSNLAWTGSTPSTSEFKLTSGSSVTIGFLANDNPPNSNGNLSYNISTTATSFDFHVKKNGSIVHTATTTGTHNYGAMNTGDVFTFEVSTAQTATINVNLTWGYSDFFGGGASYGMSGSVSAVAGGTGTYSVSPNLPEMKVSDFLADMFKRFNIVAQVEDDLTINTYHYDHYVNQGNEYNISEYVDISSYNINRPNYYSGVKFTGAEKKTILEHAFSKVNARKFGELKYLPESDGNVIDGSIYTVDLKSHIMPIEQLTNLSNALFSGLNIMLLTDKDGTEQICKPIFTYLKRRTAGTSVAYDIGSSVSSKSTFWMPQLTYTQNIVSPTNGVIGSYFGSELSEIGDDNYQDLGLYNLLWRNTIALTFDENKRRASYTAFLPLRLVKDIEPNDKLIIHNNTHLIESIETNYLTGESKLELVLITEADTDMFETQTVQNTTGSTDYFVILDPTTGHLDNVTLANNATDTSVGGLFVEILEEL
jgi:hypothetical protein